jgi:hypothetical protein
MTARPASENVAAVPAVPSIVTGDRCVITRTAVHGRPEQAILGCPTSAQFSDERICRFPVRDLRPRSAPQLCHVLRTYSTPSPTACHLAFR